MADVTVAQFAEVLKVPVDRLLQQLDQAGIKVDSAEDMISEDAKHELLTHLRRSHGRDDVQADAAPRKITLRRKSQSELKLASPQGRARTVNVEVRSKRTYVKREVLEDQARHQQEEIDRSARPRSRRRPRSSAPSTSAWRRSASTASASRRRAGGAAMKRTASAPPRKRRGARPKCRRASRASASARPPRRREARQGARDPSSTTRRRATAARSCTSSAM
jgi:translation initiation factor IF-2